MRTVRHGTDGGYYHHLRKAKTPACEPCLRAHAAATASRQQPKKDTCPDCLGPKYAAASRCRSCSNRRRVKGAAQHGTDSGYYRHLKESDLPCLGCLEAHRVATWQREHPGMPVPPRRQPKEVEARPQPLEWRRQGLIQVAV